MPKATVRAAVLAALLALALTGCASAVDDSASRTEQEPSSHAETTPTPLVAETPEASADEQAFLKYVRDEQTGFATQIPDATDGQLIAAGNEGCKRMNAGESTETISLIEGETPGEGGYYYDSAAILTGARLHLCPA